MVIAKQLYLSFLLEIFDELLCIVNSRMEVFVRSEPLSIEIYSEQRASVIAIDDSIWIKHWNDFEDEVPSQYTSIFFIR